jgi:hypothetical protein
MAMIDGIGIAMALLTGAAIGRLLTVAHYQRAAAKRHRYEQEAARDTELYAAARAAVRHYRSAGPRDSTAPSP